MSPDGKGIEKVAVLGAGAMGSGIAQAFAQAGFDVKMRDIEERFLEKGFANIRDSLERLARKGKIEEDVETVVARIKGLIDLKKAVEDADLVVEAVPEIMDLKKRVFREIDGYAPKEAIFASNTSFMSITEIAKETRREDRVAGMHFFNPVAVMKLVEIIKGEKTSEETMGVLMELGEKLEKVPVRVEKDSPGFIVNRITAANGALAGAILDKGVAEPEEVDARMMEMGQPMGVYLLMDYVGLDIYVEGQEYCEKTLSPDYKPAKFIKELVDKGELGMKTGKGIYDWSAGRPQIDSSKATDKVEPTDFIAVQINEAVKVLEEGVAKTSEEINTAMKFGMNMPFGPFEMIDFVDDLKGTLESLAEKYDKVIFAPVSPIAEDKLEGFLARYQ
jgi:enoyl-CoA hydratase/3-hydroxyacyl-CoA dehydrogenase